MEWTRCIWYVHWKSQHFPQQILLVACNFLLWRRMELLKKKHSYNACHLCVVWGCNFWCSLAHLTNQLQVFLQIAKTGHSNMLFKQFILYCKFGQISPHKVYFYFLWKTKMSKKDIGTLKRPTSAILRICLFFHPKIYL